MGRDAGREGRAVADALDDASDVGRTVELAHVARHADVAVDERFVVDDHVFIGFRGVRRFLETVGRLSEEVLPYVDLDEVKQRDDIERPHLRPWWLAVEEEVEELQADRVTLYIEPRKTKTGNACQK